MLNNNLNKMDIAGIIAGGIGVAAGLGIAVYTHFKCKKESKEIEQINEDMIKKSEEINDILDQINMVNELDNRNQELFGEED